MKKVFMFPGQGSQKTGMGEGLLQEFAQTVNDCQEILLEAVEAVEAVEAKGEYSIREICTSPDYAELLNRTDFTQPLLYLVNALYYQKSLADGKDGDIFIGHSLGEYNALQAAGGFDLLTGFRLVVKRGELMSRLRGGKMMAVLGLADDKVEEITAHHHSPNNPVEVANYNSPGQVIVSGLASALEPLETVFKENGAKKVIPLPVSGAFHSSLMKEVAVEFGEYLKDYTFSPLQKTVYSNTTALPYPENSENLEDPENDTSGTIPDYLVKQIYSPVRWTAEIRNLRQNYPEIEFEEIGPGQVLTGLVKRIL